MLYYVAWLLLQPWKLFIRAKGLENIPIKKEPMLVISNHRRRSDPWRIGIFLKIYMPISWFAKKELFCPFMAFKEFKPKKMKQPFSFLFQLVAAIISPTVVWFSKTIIVDKSNKANIINLKAFKKAISLLKKAMIAGIFPSGTIDPNENFDENFVKLGARKVIINGKEVGVVILPAYLDDGEVVFGPQFCLIPSVCKRKDDHKDIARTIEKWIESRFTKWENIKKREYTVSKEYKERRK